jgi:hypothetical protein
MSVVFQNIDPLAARIVCPPPPLVRNGGHTHWVEGWGVNILEDARYNSVRYICKYYVAPTLEKVC